jgi:hypothetical protein
MGRGDRSKVRWKNDRIKRKKERDRRRQQAAAEPEQHDGDRAS